MSPTTEVDSARTVNATRLSVIIPTHNRRELLRDAIESVLAQEPAGFELELIVVDDRSTDDTASVVAEYPTARYVRADAGSAAGARNAGLACASGEWLAFLDDDDAWLPHKLRRIAASIERTPDARVIFSAAHVCDPTLKPKAIWRGPRGAGPGGMYHGFMGSVVSPSAVVIHRDAFARVGLFDERVYRSEDRELYLRLARAGFRFVNLDEPLIYYRLRARDDPEMTLKTFRSSLAVLRAAFSEPHPLRPSLLHQQRFELMLRRYYAKSLLEAAAQARADGSTAETRRLSALAFGVSPLHWFYHRVVRRRRWLAAAQ